MPGPDRRRSLDASRAREPYEFQTDVDLEPSEQGVTVTMTVEPMHDQVWTERLLCDESCRGFQSESTTDHST